MVSMSDNSHVLLVDDDSEIMDLLSEFLKRQGFAVTEAASIREFREKLSQCSPDIIILDIMLPDGSGLDTCKSLRSEGVTTPIILLTAVKEEVDRILGLEFGADDYVSKPFNPRELVARIRAVLRRVSGRTTKEEETPSETYRFGEFTCKPAVRSVFDRDGNELQLTGAEFDLLKVFLDRPQRLISRETLLELTNKSLDTFDTTINVLISRIRKKLSAAGAPDEMFRTVRNGGYQLTVKVERI
jgi:two-component system, OmpR family, response regulator